MAGRISLWLTMRPDCVNVQRGTPGSQHMTYWVTLWTGADYGSPAIALADQPDQCLTSRANTGPVGGRSRCWG